MSELSAADIAARVVAWHNRHPLARRLSVADVFSVGHVALPFLDPTAPPPDPAAAAGAAGSLRERAMARSRQAPAAAPAHASPQDADSAAAAAGAARKPAFFDDFIPPLSPADVAVFGARHGIERSHEPGGAPVRRVPAQVGSGGLAWRWLLTAELRAGGARTRVLLGPAPGAPVLGRRLWSLPRVGALAALGGAAGALVLALGLWSGASEGPPPVAVGPGAPAPAAVTLPTEPASAASAAGVTASASAPAPALPSPGAASVAASVVAAVVPAVVPAASRPIDVEPRLGQVELPSIGGIVDARRRKAAEAAASAALSAASSAATSPARTATPAAAAAPAAAASAPVFALATRLLRTRAESQQIADALTTLLVVPGSPVQRVDVLPAGDDFRVVAWPYPGRADAERAQARLLSRGHRLQIIAF